MGLVWGLGGTLDRTGRATFDTYLRERLKKRGILRPFPPEGSVFDYYYDWGMQLLLFFAIRLITVVELSAWKPWTAMQQDMPSISMFGIKNYILLFRSLMV